MPSQDDFRLPCSPRKSTRGMVWFPRMLDKIRLHAQGKLPDEYHPWLGKGFDGRCLRFLRVMIWSDFLRKRGLRDGPEIQADLQMSKEKGGLGHRTDLDTYFRYNDVDEGRDPDGEC